MSLRAFHIFFILVSSLLCLFTGGWVLFRMREAGAANAPIYLLIIAVLGLIGLVFYLRWFIQKFSGASEEEK